jgi:hypothetical protein
MTAQQAYDQASPGKHVIGWKLDPGRRCELLARFPAAYSQAIADHVTLKAGVDQHSKLPPALTAAIVGRSDDGRGVEAMVVEIEGSTGRPDGGTYHITWSLADGRRAEESNDVIAARGWEPIDPPVAVQLSPQSFP